VVTLNRHRLEPGDGAAVSEEATLDRLAQAPARLVVFDLI
jgi:hypothetical protein